MSRKVLVTGSAGFIGGYVVEELLAAGFEVVGLDNYSKYGRVEKSYDSHPRYRLVDGDAKDVGLLKALLRVFGQAFQDMDTYQGAVPSDDYLRSLLSTPHFIVVVALKENDVIGGLMAGASASKYERHAFSNDPSSNGKNALEHDYITGSVSDAIASSRK